MRKPFRVALLVFLLFLILLSLCWSDSASAQPVEVPRIDLTIGGGEEEDPESLIGFLQLLLIIALLTLAPAFVVLMTSFTRIVVVLSFTRNAMATQQIPPNQVLIGLALFLTYFVMQPVFAQVNDEAIQPYLEGEITQEELSTAGKRLCGNSCFIIPGRKTWRCLSIWRIEPPETRDDVPLHVLVPSFVISELKTAFQMGFMLFLPFLIIDMVVASTLMSMGMFMLPPVIVSMPFKILLFVLVDGWHLVVKSLLLSFN